jgi:hypothetical protein
VTIPARARQVHFTLKPINDVVKEGPETVVVTLAANGAYTLGGTTSATVTITSNE